MLDATGTEAANATTAATGAYTVAGLAAGDYTVSVEATSFAPRFWPAADTAAQAEKLTVAAGESRTGVDVMLASIATTAPVAEAPLTDPGEAAAPLQTTDPPSPASDAVETTAPSVAPETPRAPAIAAQTVQAAETATGSIAGRVTQGADGAPIAGAWVYVRSNNGNPGSNGATTAADGTYLISGLADGDYVVAFTGPPPASAASSSYNFHCTWSSAGCEGTPEWVSVVGGAATQHIDLVLPAPGTVTGIVTSASDGKPLADVGVSAYSASGGNAYTSTSADGRYALSGLFPATDYRVCFSPSDSSFAPQCWQVAAGASTATPVAVAPAQMVGGIDASLAASGSIAGHVVDDATGAAPSVDIVVVATGQAGAFQAFTDANGDYIIHAPAGTYTVVFFPGSGPSYGRQYWNNVVTAAAAAPVTVRAGGITSGIDARMLKPTTISGHLLGLSSASGGHVSAFTASGQNAGMARVMPGSDGAYSMEVIDGSGALTLQAVDDSGMLAPQYYRNTTSVDAATPVTIGRAQTLTGIDFTLTALAVTAGGSVTSTTPLDPTSPWATIAAYQWGADSAWHEAARITGWGSYAFGTNQRVSGWGNSSLAAGTYTVGFEATGFCTQYFDAKASLDAAERFTLAAGDTKTGVNAVLSKDCVQPAVTAGSPALGGTAEVGQTLTVNPGDWQPAPVGLTYQWLADGSPIPGATGTTLALTDVLLGKTITVTATGSRPGYTSTSATSPAAGPVAPAPLKSMTPGTPTVTGSNIAGSTLTAHPGTWTPSDAAFGYQWLADGAPIAAATASTFVPGATEVGKKIAVTVTGTKAGYVDTGATSTAVGPITAVPLKPMTPGTPTISGTTKVGETLTAAPGTWTPDTASFTYQWFADGAPIAGATGSTLVLDPSTAGKTVTVTVRGAADGYDPAAATSAGVGPVTNGTLTSAVPTVAGTAQVGQSLTANPGDWGPQPVQLTYQWSVDGAPVGGATGSMFTPDATTAGKTVTVTVTGVRDGYDTASRASNPTTAVIRGALSAGQPTVSGTPVVGTPLTVAPGTWGPEPVALAYQWIVDGQPVDGATGTSFTPTPEQVGKPLSVTVTGTRDGYDPAAKTVSVGMIAPALALSASQTGPGATVTVTGSDFGPNEEVVLELHSTVYPLGTAKTDAKGAFSAQVTLPADVTGDHHIVATGKTSGRVGQAAIAIAAPAGNGGDGGGGLSGSGSSGSGSSGGLARTGSEIPLAALVLALLLVTVGGVLAWRRREAR